METRVETQLENLLNTSKAEPAFKQAVLDFAQNKNSTLIKYSPAPKIKILRVLMKLLETFSDKPIAEVTIEGTSSCSAFSGILTFGPKQTVVRFNWDCSWKAQKEGYITWYGAPDQTKAAMKFGYDCFERFEVVSE
ncbi:MAG: hypothetical protein ACE5IY_13680 [bacterium]